MSKVLYACSRYHDFGGGVEEKMTEICHELVPNNIRWRPEHRVCMKERLAYAISMHNGVLEESDMSLLLGFLYERPKKGWTTPGHSYPDGNYALFRNSDGELEVVSDAAGTRTIWYYHGNELFIASTSQRAIILFLGTFMFDERVIPWMLSTGSLGPQFSWDRRLKRLQPDSSILLNKKTWELSVAQNPIVFSEVKRSRKEHKELLANTIRKTVSSLEAIDFEYWVLPLSGGYDSRAILCFIKEQMGIPKGFRAVTWGVESSIAEDGNDAKIAKELARAIGVKHDYYQTDIASEPVEAVIDRYLFCSEGRIDHLAGYMDGMEIWRRFHDENIVGVIRGDEGFGLSKKQLTELTVKQSIGCALCTDFENLKSVIEDFGFSVQRLPSELARKDEEALCTWRDRLYHAYRIPTILSALSDIKFSYVEQINPLLSKEILTVARTLPEDLRTGKGLFKEIVDTVGPDMPFASKGANANPKDILRDKSVIDLLKREIGSGDASRLFDEGFIMYIIDGIEEGGSKPLKQRLKESVAAYLPRHIKNFIRDEVLSPRVDGNILAFRVFIILKMYKVLGEDAVKLSDGASSS